MKYPSLKNDKFFVARMAGASVTETAELLVYRELPFQGPLQKSRNTEKPPESRVILDELSNLPTETDVH